MHSFKLSVIVIVMVLLSCNKKQSDTVHTPKKIENRPLDTTLQEAPVDSKSLEIKSVDTTIPIQFEVKLDINASIESNRKIQVTVTTNLPDGAELFITAENKSTGASYSDEVKVKEYKVGPVILGPDEGLPYGNYIIEVLMPNANVQPQNVQRIIGQNGEYLKGTYVIHDDKGSDMEYVTVEKRISINVGNLQQIKESDKETAQKKLRIWNEMKTLVTDGRKMQVYRGKISPDCVDKLRVCHEKIKSLRDEIDRLPNTVQTSEWKYAINLLFDCTNCSSDALKWCGVVDSVLNSSKP